MTGHYALGPVGVDFSRARHRVFASTIFWAKSPSRAEASTKVRSKRVMMWRETPAGRLIFHWIEIVHLLPSNRR